MNTKIKFLSIFFSTILGMLTSAASQNRVEQQLIDLIESNQIERARELINIANINVNNIGGKPIIYHVFGQYVWGNSQSHSMEKMIFLYEELQQNPNHIIKNARRTAFSTYCTDLIDGDKLPRKYSNGIIVLDPQSIPEDVLLENMDSGFLARINYLLDLPVSAKELPDDKSNSSWFSRAFNVLPACILQYRSFVGTFGFREQVRDRMIVVFNKLIDKGASASYWFPIINSHDFYNGLFLSAEHLDPILLQFFVSKGVSANFAETLKVGGQLVSKRSIPYFMPRPRDEDVDAASRYISVFKSLGGDINRKQYIANSQNTFTLLEEALATGQLNYAKMLRNLK